MEKNITSYSSILGLVISAKRKQLNLEQSDVAKKMNLSQASYSRLESGKSVFSVDQMFQCAEALDIPIGELLDELLNMVNHAIQSDEIAIKAQERGAKDNVGNFIAGAALGAAIIGLIAKSKK